jgi:hypothetical protein
VEKARPENAVAVLVLLASSADGVERKRLLAKASTIAKAAAIDDDKINLIDPREIGAAANRCTNDDRHRKRVHGRARKKGGEYAPWPTLRRWQ